MIESDTFYRILSLFATWWRRHFLHTSSWKKLIYNHLTSSLDLTTMDVNDLFDDDTINSSARLRNQMVTRYGQERANDISIMQLWLTVATKHLAWHKQGRDDEDILIAAIELPHEFLMTFEPVVHANELLPT